MEGSGYRYKVLFPENTVDMRRIEAAVELLSRRTSTESQAP